MLPVSLLSSGRRTKESWPLNFRATLLLEVAPNGVPATLIVSRANWLDDYSFKHWTVAKCSSLVGRWRFIMCVSQHDKTSILSSKLSARCPNSDRLWLLICLKTRTVALA